MIRTINSTDLPAEFILRQDFLPTTVQPSRVQLHNRVIKTAETRGRLTDVLTVLRHLKRRSLARSKQNRNLASY